MNLVESLRLGASTLREAGVASPRSNSEILLGHLLGMTRLEVYTCFERELSPGEEGAFRDLLSRRSSGVPLQYITGEAGFRRLTLRIVPGVFIPRPETEVLVDKVLQAAPQGGCRVLDVGCGSGNIAVSVAVELPSAAVTAVDIDPLAVELTGENALLHGVADRVEVLEGDLFGPVRGRFDLVVSNPPYIRERDLDLLPGEVRDHEPGTALSGGEDGLAVTRRIAREAPGFLESGGYLALETDQDRGAETAQFLAEDARWEAPRSFDDLTGKRRVLLARLSDRETVSGAEGKR